RLKANGTVIDREEYYPFGDSSLRTFEKKRYRYVGKEKDLESGLYYYGARYYAAWTCRFISVDPLADKFTDLTPYNYAGDKPINKVDIDGLQEDKRQPTPSGDSGGDGSKGTGSGGSEVNAIRVEVHLVKKGESVWEIAEKSAGLNASNARINKMKDQIIEMNRLGKDGQIQPGDNLIVPESPLTRLNRSRASSQNQERSEYVTKLEDPLYYSFADGSLSGGSTNLDTLTVEPPTFVGGTDPVDLGTSKNPATDIINRLAQIVYSGGTLDDLIKPGSEIDESLIDDIGEALGGSYYGTDEAYAGSYAGSSVKLVTYKTNTSTFSYLRPKTYALDNLNPRLNQFKHRYAIQAFNTEDKIMFELRFKDKAARKKAILQLTSSQ
ncbi:MAG: hypothetical protein CL840_16185, partial [Crocinitomicaceae bacterium]|nr:hypothetical protein [Crocinitomicaceae bacterium]